MSDDSERSRAPFVEDIGEPVESMDGGIAFRRGIIGSGNGHIDDAPMYG